MITILHHTKLRIPQSSHRTLVPRPGLSAALDEGLSVKLTALTAPAGYGKTTSLSEWARRSNIRVGWVSLDRHDNDMVRFWSYTIAAVRGESPNFGEQAQLASIEEGAYTTFLDSFLGELQAVQEDMALIIDDYHVIDRPDIHRSLAYVLEYIPSRIHLYIASRTRLPFPTARLQAKGEMRLVTENELRFASEEGALFFRDCMRLELTDEDTALFVRRTEGWVSGLHLAAISLRNSDEPTAFVREFGGRQRGIAQYLLEEVLSGQDEAVRSFLLHTSILSRMNASLCEAVTGEPGAQVMLKRLERLHLFLTPLDERSEWYRYHHLFGDFLQQQFRTLQPDRWRDAHGAAARWLEDRGDAAAAVEHWLAGGRYAEAAASIEANIAALHNHRAALLGWLEAIPFASMRKRPFIQLLYLKVKAEMGDNLWVGQQLRALKHELDEPDWKSWLGAYYFLATENAIYLRNMPEVFENLKLYEIHEQKGKDNPLQMIASNTLGAPYYTNILSFFDDLREAERFLAECMRIWEEKENYPFLGYFYCFYSSLLFEWDRVEESEAMLRRIVYDGPWRPYTRIWVFGIESLAWIHLIREEASLAFAMMKDAEERLNTSDKEKFLRRLTAETAYFDLFAGHLDRVEAWVLACGLKPTDPVPSMYRDHYILARGLIELGRASEAVVLSENIVRMTVQKNWQWDRVKALTLLCLALDKQGNEEEAMRQLEAALSLGEPNGYVRTFLDEGKAMGSLLARYVRRRQSGTPGLTGNVSLAYVKRLISKLHVRLEDEVDVPVLLTGQESRILRLVEQGQKNREIAERLNVSEETVKKHLKNVYAKLEANSRVQAVTIAKQRRLI